MKKIVLICVIQTLVLGGAFAGVIMSQVEQANYTVVAQSGDIEIRDYDPMIVAQVTVPGARETAIKEGFRLLADYIFGNNSASEKVSMTAPVMQETSETISMTAPVTQTQDGQGAWHVRFKMPYGYTLQTLPRPNSPRITFLEVPSRRFAAVRFSGLASREALRAQQKALEDYLAAQKLTALSAPIFAFFNPPWTLPFLRRNEIMIEIARQE